MSLSLRELGRPRSFSSDIQKIAPQKPSVLQLSSLPDEYEERLAISEYDGLQTLPKPNALPMWMLLSLCL